MDKRILPALVLVAAAIIVWSFFMPWANVKASVTKVARSLTDKAGPLKEAPLAGKIISELREVTDAIDAFGGINIKTTVRGYDIPRLVNSKTSKVALSLAQILFKGTEGLGLKSYLVYLLPIFAFVSAALAVLGVKATQAVIAMLAVSGVVSMGGLYNLYTADFSNLVVQVVIEKSLWQTMYAYLFIFLVSAIWLILDKQKRLR